MLGISPPCFSGRAETGRDRVGSGGLPIRSRGGARKSSRHSGITMREARKVARLSTPVGVLRRISLGEKSP